MPLEIQPVFLSIKSNAVKGAGIYLSDNFIVFYIPKAEDKTVTVIYAWWKKR